MLYEDKLLRVAVEAMGQVEWEHGTPRNDESRAARAMQIAVAMESAFSATLRARRDAAEQAAKRAREDAARAEAMPQGGPPCVHCGDDAESHAVDDEERRQCMAPGCGCRQYECAAGEP